VLEHDGHGRDNLAVRVTARVAGDRLELDFSDSDPQSTAFVNSTHANTAGYAMLPILSVVDETMPRNSGLLDRIRIVTRKGTLVDPEFPAPTGWSHHHVGYEICEAVMSALARFMPERAANVAPSLPLANTIRQAARHGGTLEQLTMRDYSRLCQGHCDAAAGRDGWGMPGVFAERPLPSVEVHEIEGGGRVGKLELVTDSGGAGQWRGGLGTELVIDLPKTADDNLLTICLQAPASDAHRLNGAMRGAPCSARIALDGKIKAVERAMVRVALGAGAKLMLQMAGGAGWGDPLRREPQAVLRDVRDGYVSVESAARDYGVAIDPERLEIDAAATARLRSTPRGAQAR
jgi:N-methylhydantoinase B